MDNRSAIDQRQSDVAEMMVNKVRKQELNDFKAVLLTPEGRRFYARLCDRCFENQSTFTGNAKTYANEGMRNVILMLKKDIEDMGSQGRLLRHKAENEYFENMSLLQTMAEGEVDAITEHTAPSALDPRNILRRDTSKNPNDGRTFR